MKTKKGKMLLRFPGENTSNRQNIYFPVSIYIDQSTVKNNSGSTACNYWKRNETVSARVKCLLLTCI